MKALTCAATRRRLHAFHDGELTVSDQIAVAAHLDWCDSCATALDDFQLIGVALRRATAARGPFPVDDQVSLRAAVVDRMKAERTVSLASQMQLMFEDLHLVYAGAAAAVAALVCVVVMLGMMRFATSVRPDSLAALVGLLTPGSNQNPVAVRDHVQMPKPLDPAFSTSSPADGGGDAAFALAAVITREGRVANLELLHSIGEQELMPGTDEARIVANLLDAVSRARFEPASVAGLPVAVNMVWLVAHTTVRATARAAEPPALPADEEAPGRVADRLDRVRAAPRLIPTATTNDSVDCLRIGCRRRGCGYRRRDGESSLAGVLFRTDQRHDVCRDRELSGLRGASTCVVATLFIASEARMLRPRGPSSPSNVTW